ncbi:MAG: hypothetical protein SFV55_01350 [Haliscomenobacter sp.]|uniref:hypothetical protein n=1 Tax=Haliscomenobacter sp. TaxID=2717303 RepID=UPI0029A637FF|nr:hypothetical protein [Haliscomenobacter sp.]MDX2067035.1 hypothetical protein [Haliscomenobacter sp.]
MKTPAPFITEIKQLLANSKIEVALSKLISQLKGSPKQNEVIQQSSRFKSISEENRLGIISHEAFVLIQNQVTNGLLKLLDEMELGFEAPTVQPQPEPLVPLHPAPTFPKLDVKKFQFEHALRAAQVKNMIARLPDSLQLLGKPGWGRHRFMEDLEACGIQDEVQVVRVKLSDFIKSYPDFLAIVASKAKVPAQPGEDLVEIIRNSARLHQKPVLFVLENVDDMFAGKSEMDAGFSYDFFVKLNTLKNESFSVLWLSVYESVSHRMFGTQSSPLTLPEIELNQLTYEQLGAEIRRRVPELGEETCVYLQEQLETEPNHTHALLEALLTELEANPTSDKKDIKRLLIEKRQKLNGNGRR